MQNLITINSTNSTNELINVYPNNTILLAKEQTKGKGRHSKIWLSPSSGLYMSHKISLPQNCIHSFISIAVGIACHKILTSLTNQVLFLKWPNDILDGKEQKLAGILIEIKDERFLKSPLSGDLGVGFKNCIIGIGINFQSIENFGYIQTDMPKELIALLLANEIMNILNIDTEENIKYWLSHSVFKVGDTIQAHSNDKKQTIIGQFHSLNQEGNLILINEKRERIELNANFTNHIRKK